MTSEHPSEAALFAYVEDELDTEEQTAVETHLAVCEQCAGDVALVRRGREELRAWPLLDSPPGLAERMLGGIARREPRPERRKGRGWLSVVVPVAAALALVGGVATLSVVGGGGDDDAEVGGAGMAEESALDSGGEAAGEGQSEAAPAQALEKRVSADPRELARELVGRGFDARVEDGAVVVDTDRRAALRRILRQYDPGDVEVRVE